MHSEVDYDCMIHSLYAVQWTLNSVDDHPFKRCNEDFLKAAIFPSLAGEEASCLVCGDGIMYSFTLSHPEPSLGHERDLSSLIIIETWRGAKI